MARGAGTGRGAGSGRVGTPGHLAGVPAPRAEIRLGRPVRTERGATPGRLRGLGPQEVGPFQRLGSWLLLSTPAAFFQDRPREGLISGTAATAPSGRGGGGGRLARRLGERPGGPGLGPPQPPPLAAGGTPQAVPDKAGNFPTWWGKHQNKRPSGAGARPPQPAPPSTRPPPVPATGPDLSRPLRGRPAGI